MNEMLSKIFYGRDDFRQTARISVKRHLAETFNLLHLNLHLKLQLNLNDWNTLNFTLQ